MEDRPLSAQRAAWLKTWIPETPRADLVGGMVSGIMNSITGISIAFLIFSDLLEPFLPTGIAVVLFSSLLLGIVVALTSSFPANIASAQDRPAAIMATIAASIASLITAQGDPAQTLPTILVAMQCSALLIAIFHFAFGQLNLGSLIRFFPYPVIGGFMAGAGWLLVHGTFNLLTRGFVGWDNLDQLFTFWPHWLPALLFGGVLLVCMRRYKHVLLLPGFILFGIGLFFLVLAGVGTSVEEARSQHLLLGPFPAGHLLAHVTWPDYHLVNWPVLLAQVGSLMTLVIVSAVALLLNSSALEVATKQDVNLNAELKVTGFANLVAGLFGSVPGYNKLSHTALHYKMGARSRLTGVMAGMMCGIFLLIDPALLSYMPDYVVGGLLLFIGMDFLVEWLWDARKTIPKVDYSIIVGIIVSIGVWGIMTGVAIGLAISTAMFIVNYSKTSVIKHELTGANHRSHLARGPAQNKILDKQGSQLKMIFLQGYLFFGTANTLLEHVRKRIFSVDPPAPRLILLDFRSVTGMDSSVGSSFIKMEQRAHENGIRLIYTSQTQSMRKLFQKMGCFALQRTDGDPTCIAIDSFESGLEWSEEVLLQEYSHWVEHLDTIRQQLLHGMGDPAQVDIFLSYLEKVQLEPNAALFQQNDPTDGIYFLESGRIFIQLTRPNGAEIRLRTMGAGTIVGEMGVYTQQARNAAVIAEQPCVLYFLSLASLDRMHTEHPMVAMNLHQMVIRMLSERLVHSNKVLSELI